MALKVKNINTNAVCEAVKNEDGSYTVEGKTLSREDMAKSYRAVKEEVKKDTTTKDIVILQGETEIGGSIGGLALALAKCQGEFTAVKKGSSGHGYNYADIEAVLKATMPITSANGVAITQMNISKQVDNISYIGVKTLLIHSDGGYISSEIFTPIEKTKMNSLVQMAGVNISYLRRYGIQSALCLATTDNDGRGD